RARTRQVGPAEHVPGHLGSGHRSHRRVHRRVRLGGPRMTSTGATRALIFDCAGVLADTERDAHLPAFNQTFADAGVPIHWSQEEYGHLLAIGGGKERLASVFTPVFAETAGLPTDPDAQKQLIA